jgi:hypothetical protein
MVRLDSIDGAWLLSLHVLTCARDLGIVVKVKACDSPQAYLYRYCGVLANRFTNEYHDHVWQEDEAFFADVLRFVANQIHSDSHHYPIHAVTPPLTALQWEALIDALTQRHEHGFLPAHPRDWLPEWVGPYAKTTLMMEEDELLHVDDPPESDTGTVDEGNPGQQIAVEEDNLTVLFTPLKDEEKSVQQQIRF